MEHMIISELEKAASTLMVGLQYSVVSIGHCYFFSKSLLYSFIVHNNLEGAKVK